MSLVVQGELTVSSASEQAALLLPAALDDTAAGDLELDLSGVLELDTAGLQLLLLLHREALHRGRSVRLLEVPETVIAVLGLAGLGVDLQPREPAAVA